MATVKLPAEAPVANEPNITEREGLYRGLSSNAAAPRVKDELFMRLITTGVTSRCGRSFLSLPYTIRRVYRIILSLSATTRTSDFTRPSGGCE